MDINQVLKDASKEIELANSQADIQNLKVSYLGKKGKITELLKSLKDLSLEEKKTKGAQGLVLAGTPFRLQTYLRMSKHAALLAK